MTTKFPGLPTVPSSVDARTRLFLTPLLQTVVQLTKVAGGSQPFQLAPYPVAALPPNIPGLMAYASDGRKAGELAGKGSGVVVFSDVTKWCAVDTGLPVTK